MNTYVTFEQAKLLKEKGFDVICKKKCFLDKEDNEVTDEFIFNKYNNHLTEELDVIKSVWAISTIPRPEQWQVVEWLRINHGIWITVANVYSEYTHWAFTIGKNGKGQIVPFRQDQDKSDYFKIPQEAYSAAFDYILKELI